MNKRPTVLIIRDGWGYSENTHRNPIHAADTPNEDHYRANHSRSLLEASGEAVGLLEGFYGNSEINHLNMGAGRVIRQDVARIHAMIEDESLFEINRLKLTMERCISGEHTLHLFGILQDSAVHAHIHHVKALLDFANKLKIPKISVHIFSDGRDSAPRSVEHYIKELEPHLGAAKIATITGRFFLDRGGDYELTKKAYHVMCSGAGERFETLGEAIAEAYAAKTDRDEEMTDEFIEPSVIGDYTGMQDGDSALFFNFRQDRGIQITKAFMKRMWGGPEIFFTGLTRYYDEFDNFILPPLSPEKDLKNSLGETLSHEGLRQVRIADSQKFRHVTSFFNGKRVAPFEGEDRIEIALPHPDRYIEEPAMGAYEITEVTEKIIAHCVYDLVVLNFSNGDNVGHTANEEAATKAAAAVDECVGRVVNATLARDGAALITADHGNCEKIVTEEGELYSAHTDSPVELFCVTKTPKEITLKKEGIIPNLAPTILDVMGVDIPPQMSAASLVEKN